MFAARRGMMRLSLTSEWRDAVRALRRDPTSQWEQPHDQLASTPPFFSGLLGGNRVDRLLFRNGGPC